MWVLKVKVKKPLWGIILAIAVLLVLATLLLLNRNNETVKTTPVNDPQILSYIWDEYIFDAIPTIANQPFASSDQVDRGYAIQYAVKVMCRNGIYENLGDGWGRIDPETASEWINLYLNTTINDIIPARDFIFTGTYNSEKDAFCINDMNFTDGGRKYNEMNPWGIKLDSVSKNEVDNIYTIKLVHHASAQSSRITKEINCVLQERPDGTMYFVSLLDTYPANEELIVIDGDYKKLSPTTLKINPTDKEWPLQVMKNHNGKIFIRTENGKEGSNYENIIRVYDQHTFKELASFGSSEQFTTVKAARYGYMLISSENVIRLDKNLKMIENIMIPEEVLKGAFENNWWGGMDVSEDGRYYVYSSHTQGLMLYDSHTKTTKLLSKHLPENSKFEYTPYIMGPAFVDHDKKVAAKINGYESIGGYIMSDLKTGETKDLTMNNFSYNNINTFDSNLPAAYGISSQTENIDGTGKRNIYITKMDYAKMEMSQSMVTLTNDNQRNPLSPETWSVTLQNENYLVYVSAQFANTGDSAENLYFIEQIDLNTMKAETLLSIKAGYPNLLGMFENGQVIFSYYFENASGLGITTSPVK